MSELCRMDPVDRETVERELAADATPEAKAFLANVDAGGELFRWSDKHPSIDVEGFARKLPDGTYEYLLW